MPGRNHGGRKGYRSPHKVARGWCAGRIPEPRCRRETGLRWQPAVNRTAKDSGDRMVGVRAVDPLQAAGLNADFDVFDPRTGSLVRTVRRVSVPAIHTARRQYAVVGPCDAAFAHPYAQVGADVETSGRRPHLACRSGRPGRHLAIELKWLRGNSAAGGESEDRPDQRLVRSGRPGWAIGPTFSPPNHRRIENGSSFRSVLSRVKPKPSIAGTIPFD